MYIYEGKSLSKGNCILVCMEQYAEEKILFQDTEWPLCNTQSTCRDDLAVCACATARTRWPQHF